MRPFYMLQPSDRPALSDKRRTVTYNEFIQEVTEKKAWLNSLGYGPGHRICVQGPNAIETYVMLVAASMDACGTTLPMNASELEEKARIEANNANCIIRFTKDAEYIGIEHRHFEKTMAQPKEYMCYYSSGTTNPYGFTKCFSSPYELDEDNWGCSNDLTNAYRIQGNPDYANPETNRSISVMVPYIAWGQDVVYNTLYMGGWTYLMYEPEEYDYACDLIKPTWICAFPLALQKIMNTNKGHHKLNTVEFGGIVVNEKQMNDIQEFFGPQQYINVYGEGAIGTTFCNFAKAGEDITHIGKQMTWHRLSGGEVRIGDRGTLEIRGLNTPNQTWWDTGDIVEVDENGNYRITGRAEEIFINRGGGKLYPHEVAAYIGQMPGIKDVYVYPIADEAMGQIPGCVYSGDVTPKEFMEYTKTKVAGWQVPVKFTRVKNTMSMLVHDQCSPKISILKLEKMLSDNPDWVVDEHGK
jgi:acyl-CoA synthetase (AMP-forming)/AMP-acid ligase II